MNMIVKITTSDMELQLVIKKICTFCFEYNQTDFSSLLSVLNRCIPTVVGDAITSSLQTASGQNVSAADVEEGSL